MALHEDLCGLLTSNYGVRRHKLIVNDMWNPEFKEASNDERFCHNLISTIFETVFDGFHPDVKRHVRVAGDTLWEILFDRYCIKNNIDMVSLDSFIKNLQWRRSNDMALVKHDFGDWVHHNDKIMFKDPAPVSILNPATGVSSMTHFNVIEFRKVTPKRMCDAIHLVFDNEVAMAFVMHGIASTGSSYPCMLNGRYAFVLTDFGRDMYSPDNPSEKLYFKIVPEVCASACESINKLAITPFGFYYNVWDGSLTFHEASFFHLFSRRSRVIGQANLTFTGKYLANLSGLGYSFEMENEMTEDEHDFYKQLVQKAGIQTFAICHNLTMPELLCPIISGEKKVSQDRTSDMTFGQTGFKFIDVE